MTALVVVPDEDQDAVAVRLAEFEEELSPSHGVGRYLARRAALLSVRLDRSFRHEAAMISREVRRGERRYDDERQTYVEQLGSELRDEPATVVRRLRTMPEGIDWLISVWEGIKTDLLHPTRDLWDRAHWDRLESLRGRTPFNYPVSDLEPLARAAWGDFHLLEPGQGEGPSHPDRTVWARQALASVIDNEVAALNALRPNLDLAGIEADRAEAGRRALFDTSSEAVLARKYESAAERGLFRTLRELREIEAPARASESADVEMQAESTPEAETAEAVGSFVQNADEPIPTPARTLSERPVLGSIPPNPPLTPPPPLSYEQYQRRKQYF